jgi:hypothetical protein
MSLDYLSQTEQRIAKRISPLKIEMTPKLQQMLCQFIFSYHQALLNSDIKTLLQFYAPTVNYHHLGEISKQIISEEKEIYFQRWQYVEQNLLEMPEVFETKYTKEIQVSYLFKFRVEKQQGSIPSTMSGKGRQLWRLKTTEQGFVIIQENQQVFYRHDN